MQENATAAALEGGGAGEAYSAPPDPLLGFKGSLCSRKGEGRKGEERERKVKGGEGRTGGERRGRRLEQGRRLAKAGHVSENCAHS